LKIVLAYSGGLDTSVALRWLIETYDAEVIAFCADIGQVEPLDEVRQRATETGALAVRIEPLATSFLTEFAIPAMQMHARYEGKYLLAAPLSRPLIAQRLVELAHELGADAVAHGATAKGNDQVRFYSSIMALDPSLRVIAPVMEWEMRNRSEEHAYARRYGIRVPDDEESPYSIDTNLWGTSIECGELDDVEYAPPADSWQITRSPASAPESPTRVSLSFKNGIPVRVNGQDMSPLRIVTYLNEIGAQNGVGRIDIIESRISGIKTRGIYEAPAATILMAAHEELESLVLDRETLHHKNSLASRYAELVYYGYWFSDLRRALDAYSQIIQERVSGDVSLELFKGTCVPVSRRSQNSRYDTHLATYGSNDSFNHAAGAGFSYVWSLPIRANRDK
jgi:argininosuccinate synthase